MRNLHPLIVVDLFGNLYGWTPEQTLSQPVEVLEGLMQVAAARARSHA